MIDVRSCNEIRSLMADWLDGELSAVLTTRVAEHLAACDECQAAFTRMHALGEDLSLLGSAADRIAESATLGVRRPRFWQQPWVRAAAVVILVAGGLVVVNVRRTALTPDVVVDRTSTHQKIANPAVSLDEAALVAAGDCRVSGHTAVAMASTNPRVRIVWLYEDAGAAAGSTNSGGVPKPKPQG